ncbi:hypothetical protein BKA70DRAFT_1531878 [Coprinopsis sp. MPI-PUGE-AT-0042]|nr:hypothetical protein BKA70DRAFT_1531878 [Coprinopsis sp. MPI-PUGE-AT-0042]
MAYLNNTKNSSIRPLPSSSSQIFHGLPLAALEPWSRRDGPLETPTSAIIKRGSMPGQRTYITTRRDGTLFKRWTARENVVVVAWSALVLLGEGELSALAEGEDEKRAKRCLGCGGGRGWMDGPNWYRLDVQSVSMDFSSSPSSSVLSGFPGITLSGQPLPVE